MKQPCLGHTGSTGLTTDEAPGQVEGRGVIVAGRQLFAVIAGTLPELHDGAVREAINVEIPQEETRAAAVDLVQNDLCLAVLIKIKELQPGDLLGVLACPQRSAGEDQQMPAEAPGDDNQMKVTSQLQHPMEFVAPQERPERLGDLPARA